MMTAGDGIRRGEQESILQRTEIFDFKPSVKKVMQP